MRKLVAVASAAVLVLVFAASAVADRPTEVPFFDFFTDTNPCTGELHDITITGTSFVHSHQGKLFVRTKRTIITTSGFEGQGMSTSVDNGTVSVFKLSDLLTNATTGEHIKATFVIVLDASTFTVRAINGGVTCLGR